VTGTRSNRRAERGAVLVWVALLVVVLLACVALAVDIGFLYVTRAQLQNAADAGALAAMAAIRDGESKTDAREQAVAVAESNEAAGANVQLDPETDVVFGTYSSEEQHFEPGGYFTDATAAKVIARRTGDSPAGPVPLFFAHIFGRSVADVVAEGVAAVGRREVVILQDCTRSFTEEIGDAKAADWALVQAMADQNLAGDQVGVATFVDRGTERLALSPIPDAMSAIATAIDGIEATTIVGLGTNIAPGFNTARQILRRSDAEDAEKVIVLVSDGMPNPPSRRQPAIAAADSCAREGISIFTVTLTQESGGAYGMEGADAEFNAGLVRGFGEAYETPNSEDLVALLVLIARQMPVRLVE